jgi:hypothetical protein
VIIQEPTKTLQWTVLLAFGGFCAFSLHPIHKTPSVSPAFAEKGKAITLELKI